MTVKFNRKREMHIKRSGPIKLVTARSGVFEKRKPWSGITVVATAASRWATPGTRKNHLHGNGSLGTSAVRKLL